MCHRRVRGPLSACHLCRGLGSFYVVPFSSLNFSHLPYCLFFFLPLALLPSRSLSLWRELSAKVCSAGREWTPRRKPFGRWACPCFDRLAARPTLPRPPSLSRTPCSASKEPATLVPARDASQVCIYCTLAVLGSIARINQALGFYVLIAFLRDTSCAKVYCILTVPLLIHFPRMSLRL